MTLPATNTTEGPYDFAGRNRSVSPFVPFRWLRTYDAAWLSPDVIAGLTLAAYAVPVSLAYASLAGVPPQCGIYCYLIGGIGYAAFGSSRQLAIGPTSAISMLVGATILGMGVEDPERSASIAALAALMVAVFAALAYMLRLSTLVNFISETILTGFKAGAALTIAMTQLPKLFGVAGGGENFFERAWMLGQQLPATNVVALSMGLVAVMLLVAGEKVLPGKPIALAVVALSIGLITWTPLGHQGLVTVGELAQGLPSLRLPSLRPRDVDGIIPMAAACFVLAYIEGVSAARTLAQKHDQPLSPRVELLGLAAANACTAFGQGFPVAGGLSQSVVNDKAGAKSPLALVCASVALACALMFLTGLLRNLPTMMLAAIVLVAVRGLIDISELRHLYRVSKYEFSIAVVAFSGVLILGILRGVLVAAVASLLMLLRSASQPHVAILARIPGSRRYSDRERHRDNEEVPGAFLFRVEGSLLYFNCGHVLDTVTRQAHATSNLRLVVCDLSNAPNVDLAGARMLTRLHRDLAGRGISFRVVEARSKVRDLLRAEDVESRVGYLGRHLTLDAVVAEHEAIAPSTSHPKQA